MAVQSLSDFFDTFYYANADRAVQFYKSSNHALDAQIAHNLWKAVLHVAHGPYAPAMRAAARAWMVPLPAADASIQRSFRPRLHARLKATMLAADPPRLTRGQVTRAVTCIRQDLEAWLRAHAPGLCPPAAEASAKAKREQPRIPRQQKLRQRLTRRQARFEHQEQRTLARMAAAARIGK